MATSIRLSPDLEQRLDSLAQKTKRSRAFFIREAIEAQLDRFEWEQDVLQRVADVRSGKRQTVPAEEVYKNLGLED